MSTRLADGVEFRFWQRGWVNGDDEDSFIPIRLYHCRKARPKKEDMVTEEQLMRVARAMARAHMEDDGMPYLQHAKMIVVALEEIEKIKTELWGREGEE